MSESNLPAQRKNTYLTSLTPEERVDKAIECAKGYQRGESYASMSRRLGLTVSAVQTLIKEHATYIRRARPDTRTLQEESYRKYIGRMQDIQEQHTNYPALVVSTAIQGEMSAMTRLDKILGHEAAGDVEGMAEGVAGLIRRASESGYFDRVDVQDLADLTEDEIMEAEVIDEE